MDFTLTPEEEVMREGWEEFFAAEEKNAPEGWMGGILPMFETDEGWNWHRQVAKKLGEKGWLSLAWSKKYGGQELGFIAQLIFSEIRSYHRVPGVDIWGTQIVAGSLLEYGSEDVKQRWLPGIASGDINWCQGWSEPDAGSDLASLKTRAVEDGDDYVINGQKIWTSGAHRADHIFFLARTDPEAPKKHRGLTYFLSSLDKPGITINPLIYMHGGHDYNEVFFDNFRVSKRDIVGEVNQGWYVTMAGINFERSMVGTISEARRDLEDLIAYCRETSRGGQSLASIPWIRHRLADLAIQSEAARQWAYYVAWLQTKHAPAAEIARAASASKYFSTEMDVRLGNAGVETMGLYGTLKKDSKWAPLYGKFEYKCQATLGLTIAAGTTETMYNIIAWMGLGLPRPAGQK